MTTTPSPLASLIEAAQVWEAADNALQDMIDTDEDAHDASVNLTRAEHALRSAVCYLPANAADCVLVERELLKSAMACADIIGDHPTANLLRAAVGGEGEKP